MIRGSRFKNDSVLCRPWNEIVNSSVDFVLVEFSKIKPLSQPYFEESLIGFPVQSTLMVSEDGQILEISHIDKRITINGLKNLRKLPKIEKDFDQIYACEYKGK